LVDVRYAPLATKMVRRRERSDVPIPAISLLARMTKEATRLLSSNQFNETRTPLFI
jgi:hypothetical protein